MLTCKYNNSYSKIVVVDLLLRAGINVGVMNSKGQTVYTILSNYMCSTKNDSKMINTEIIQMLANNYRCRLS